MASSTVQLALGELGATLIRVWLRMLGDTVRFDAITSCVSWG